jgi:hypothetical protein
MSAALRRTSASAFAALLWLMATSAAAAADHVVILRAYNTYGVSDHAVQTASRTVRRLFSDAGIDAKWRDCRIVGRRSNQKSDPCSDPLKANELIVRVVAGTAIEDGDATMTLGNAFIDPVTRNGALATIYADRVAMMANALRVDVGTMVGRAIAHEIAHLLLGTHAHTAAGIMRATWRSATVLRTEEADWLFTQDQRTAMRLAVTTRLVREGGLAGPAVMSDGRGDPKVAAAVGVAR